MVFSSEADFAAYASALVERIGEALIEKGASAACAESLTGGLLASEIVRVPGVSKWFREGCVTYSDAAKENRLRVDPAVIEAHTAKLMAEGELEASGADLAVSTTGLAGPGPDELGRPAGLVFIGGATEKGSVTKELRLAGSRLDIRRSAVCAALELMLGLTKNI